VAAEFWIEFTTQVQLGACLKQLCSVGIEQRRRLSPA
jgi:hypothetical protein